MRTTSALLSAVVAAATIQSAYSFCFVKNMPLVSAYFMRTSEAVQFLNGSTKGLVGEDLGADLGQCLAESNNLVEELEISISTLEKGDLTNIVNGIFRLIHVVDQIPQVFADCKQISQSALEKLSNFAKRFADFNALFHKVSMNMLFHGSEIINDFHQANEFLQASDFYNSGLFGGLAIAVATQ